MTACKYAYSATIIIIQRHVKNIRVRSDRSRMPQRLRPQDQSCCYTHARARGSNRSSDRTAKTFEHFKSSSSLHTAYMPKWGWEVYMDTKTQGHSKDRRTNSTVWSEETVLPYMTIERRATPTAVTWSAHRVWQVPIIATTSRFWPCCHQSLMTTGCQDEEAIHNHYQILYHSLLHTPAWGVGLMVRVGRETVTQNKFVITGWLPLIQTSIFRPQASYYPELLIIQSQHSVHQCSKLSRGDYCTHTLHRQAFTISQTQMKQSLGLIVAQLAISKFKKRRQNTCSERTKTHKLLLQKHSRQQAWCTGQTNTKLRTSCWKNMLIYTRASYKFELPLVHMVRTSN